MAEIWSRDQIWERGERVGEEKGGGEVGKRGWLSDCCKRGRNRRREEVDEGGC